MRRRFAGLLRAPSAAGIAALLAAALGFAAANSPMAAGYAAFGSLRFGPEALGLHLSLSVWATDGLLAVFFFVVGLELKHEFVAGSLRRRATALVPVGAAFGGVLLPALIFLAFNAGASSSRGWAIPTATDIAFAVMVLALAAPRIPNELRVFLLTLAVVDDLIAIVIIAVFYAEALHWGWLALALLPLLMLSLLLRFVARRITASAWFSCLVLLPLGVVTWALVHASGVHATVAGVLLAFAVPAALPRHTASSSTARSDPQQPSLAAIFAHRFVPVSNWIAVPVFAFFAAGVTAASSAQGLVSPLGLGVFFALLFGKPLGIGAAAVLLLRMTRTSFAGTSRRDFIGVCCLGGIGFTVSLLLAELSFDGLEADAARLAVLAASLAAAALGAVLLARRRTITTAH